MPSPNFVICGPRSCASAGALVKNPAKETNVAAAMILMRSSFQLASRNAMPKLSLDPSKSPMLPGQSALHLARAVGDQLLDVFCGLRRTLCQAANLRCDDREPAPGLPRPRRLNRCVERQQ